MEYFGLSAREDVMTDESSSIHYLLLFPASDLFLLLFLKEQHYTVLNKQNRFDPVQSHRPSGSGKLVTCT